MAELPESGYVSLHYSLYMYIGKQKHLFRSNSFHEYAERHDFFHKTDCGYFQSFTRLFHVNLS